HPPMRSTFPYTTLFRSSQALAAATPEALVDDFLHKSGLWAQLAQIEPGVQLGITQSDGQFRQLNDEQLGRLRDAASGAYEADRLDRKSTRLNSSHQIIS